MEVLRRFVDGDINAFEAIYREHERDIYRVLLRMVRDPATAEDLVIETFWRVYRSRATFDWRRSFQTWVRRIATNVARDHLRRRRLEVELPESLQQPSQADPVVTKEIRLHLHRAVAELPVTQRMVVMLALVEGMPQQEVAEAMGIPLGTVKSRLFHAVRLLRKKLQRSGIEP